MGKRREYMARKGPGTGGPATSGWGSGGPTVIVTPASRTGREKGGDARGGAGGGAAGLWCLSVGAEARAGARRRVMLSASLARDMAAASFFWRHRISLAPWAYMHVSPYGHFPLSRQLRHRRVLYLVGSRVRSSAPVAAPGPVH
jgi:hypothetical protein